MLHSEDHSPRSSVPAIIAGLALFATACAVALRGPIAPLAGENRASEETRYLLPLGRKNRLSYRATGNVRQGSGVVDEEARIDLSFDVWKQDRDAACVAAITSAAVRIARSGTPVSFDNKKASGVEVVFALDREGFLASAKGVKKSSAKDLNGL